MQTVFAIVSFGAIMLTVNVVLLGGNIGFFQVWRLGGACVTTMCDCTSNGLLH